MALVILAAAGTFLGSGIVFFSLPFWMSRTKTTSRQLWDLPVTFSLYPEPLVGGALRFVLFTVLQARFIGYLPVRIVRIPSVRRSRCSWPDLRPTSRSACGCSDCNFAVHAGFGLYRRHRTC